MLNVNIKFLKTFIQIKTFKTTFNAGTSCPGQYLYTSMRRWNRYVSGPLDDYFCPFQGGQQEDEDEEKNYVYFMRV